ncbi:MAG: VOC family protein [Gemmatimonadota bacterium]
MTPDRPAARRIFETALYGDDIPAMRDFYERVLGLETVSEMAERGVALRCGPGVLLLFDPDVTGEGSELVGAHGARGPGHVAFSVPAEELDVWRAHLADCGVEIESEVHWPAGGRSVYFRDPAGNSVELAVQPMWGLEDGG